MRRRQQRQNAGKRCLTDDDAADPSGWALIVEPTDKEKRYCQRLGIEIIAATVGDLLIACEEASIAA